jgi:hypothetical protein
MEIDFTKKAIFLSMYPGFARRVQRVGVWRTYLVDRRWLGDIVFAS